MKHVSTMQSEIRREHRLLFTDAMLLLASEAAPLHPLCTLEQHHDQPGTERTGKGTATQKDITRRTRVNERSSGRAKALLPS